MIAAVAVVVAGAYIVSAIHEPLVAPLAILASVRGQLPAAYLLVREGRSAQATCEYLFERISAVPPFNTPAGFADCSQLSVGR